MGYAKNNGRKKREEDGGLSSVIRSSFVGVGFAMVLGIPLWLLCSLIAYLNDDPDSMVGALGLVILYAVSLASGFISTKRCRGAGLMCGAISGGILALFFFVISLFFGAGYESSYGVILRGVMRAATVLMSVLGAYAGAQRKRSPSRRRRR